MENISLVRDTVDRGEVQCWVYRTGFTKNCNECLWKDNPEVRVEDRRFLRSFHDKIREGK